MIVIPMAGASRRFAEAGYVRPKYELPLEGRSVFAHAVESFRAYFTSHSFLFVVGPAPGAADFVAEACAELGVADARVVALDAPTAGQAETVEKGLAAAGASADVPLTIFNIDTFRPGFRFPGDEHPVPPPLGEGNHEVVEGVLQPIGPLRHGAVAPRHLPRYAGEEKWSGISDGWLEVFRGSGSNWSYVRPDEGPEPLALETAEKRPISDLCCTGLYHFARASDFAWALARERVAPSMNELYVAPLYNALIGAGRRIHYRLIERDEVVFCGTPAEYQALGGLPA